MMMMIIINIIIIITVFPLMHSLAYKLFCEVQINSHHKSIE